MTRTGNAKIHQLGRGGQVYIQARVFDDSQNPLRDYEGECVAEIVPRRGILIRKKNEGDI